MKDIKKLILHRGYKGKYPENSYISFSKALEEGLSFETDIRTSKDKKCFLIHDDSLDRLFNVGGKICDKKSGELKKCSYKKDLLLKLFGLEDLCLLVEGKRNQEFLSFIHIKELDDLAPAVKIIGKYDLSEKIRFFACDDITMNLIDIVKSRYPEYKVGLHITDDSPYINKRSFKKTDFIWADEIKKENITKKLIELAHEFKKPVYAISPELISESIFNEYIEKKWGEYLSIGVDGICTDKPQEFLSFVDKNSSFKKD